MFPSKFLPPLLSLLFLSLLFPLISSDDLSPRPNILRRSLRSNEANHQSNTTSLHPPPSLAREFLHAHNKVRLNFKQPVFKWDRSLARYARRWGSKRALDCKMIHSYGPYGENLFWGGRDHWTATEAVESWVNESEFYDADKNLCSQGQICGHYTQIVWRESVNLGCARVKCQNGGVLMICEYDPPGNYIDESPFGDISSTINSFIDSPPYTEVPEQESD